MPRTAEEFRALVIAVEEAQRVNDLLTAALIVYLVGILVVGAFGDFTRFDRWVSTMLLWPAYLLMTVTRGIRQW